ncbi:hypothetical protein [Streptomyces apocyni]|uniref:hypothetical protein n=1 Tax=Streptomyces apocyni TaxID=2654677 RepID=UPI0012EB0244|nr:hypothetical protein [Streptomyces apocyni]
MIDFPVSLPPEHIPAGTPAWQSADARRWAATVPGRWTHPLWASLALLATTLWAVLVVDTTPVCTQAAPCGPEWWGMTLAGLALLELYWIWRQPALALLVIGPLTGTVLLSAEALGTTPGTARIAVLVAAVFAALTLLERVAARQRQRTLAERAAGPGRHPAPASAIRFKRGRASMIMAAPLLAVAVFAAWQGVDAVARDQARAARATLVRAQVTEQGEESLTVRLPDGGKLTLDALSPENHPVGTETAVLVEEYDGGGEDTVGAISGAPWARLVAEPYDASGWQLLLLGAALPGLAFLSNGIDGRRRRTRLNAGPLPVLRVLVREGDTADTYVYAADDLAGEHPIFRVYTARVDDPTDDEHGEHGEHGDSEGGRADHAATEAVAAFAAAFRNLESSEPLREAVLYGSPHTGGELTLVATDDDEVVVECSAAPVRTPRAFAGLLPSGTGAKLPTGPGPGDDHRDRDPAPEAPGRERTRMRSPEETAASITPTERPQRWSAGPVGRAGGVLMLVVETAVIWGLLNDPDGFRLSWVFALAFLPTAVNAIAVALNWRITADRSGLWVAGAWRVRHITWADLDRAEHTGDGIVLHARAPQPGKDAVRVSLICAGWPWLERRLGADTVSLRAVEEIRALHTYPALRPTEDSAPGDQGMPLGPLAVVATVVWAAVVLLLL